MSYITLLRGVIAERQDRARLSGVIAERQDRALFSGDSAERQDRALFSGDLAERQDRVRLQNISALSRQGIVCHWFILASSTTGLPYFLYVRVGDKLSTPFLVPRGLS